MSAAWNAWAQRADVLPLGTWRGSGAKTDGSFSKERRFVLKSGEHLARDKSPAIAGRAFTITAKFDPGNAKNGVIVAQGGNAHGYTLYLADGKLTFLVRSAGEVASVTTSAAVSGPHTAIARLDAKGTLTLALNNDPAATVASRVIITAMPVDGLDVGSDAAGAVGPYKAPNSFAGTIESVVVELDAP